MIFLHDITRRGQPAYEATIAERLASVAPSCILQVHNKCDSQPADGMPALPAGAIALSAHTGAGLDALRQALLQRAGWPASTEDVDVAHKRHLLALQRSAAHLQAARCHAASGDTAPDLFAEELRLAHDALSEITGAVTSDDLLGEIFAGFCIESRRAWRRPPSALRLRKRPRGPRPRMAAACHRAPGLVEARAAADTAQAMHTHSGES